MYNSPDPVDLRQIELQAKEMRAQYLRDAIRSFLNSISLRGSLRRIAA